MKKLMDRLKSCGRKSGDQADDNPSNATVFRSLVLLIESLKASEEERIREHRRLYTQNLILAEAVIGSSSHTMRSKQNIVQSMALLVEDAEGSEIADEYRRERSVPFDGEKDKLYN